MATVIQEGKMSAPNQGGLFQGKKFWLSRKVPGRNHFIQGIKANGGEVMTSEKDADICLVDHLKDDTDDGMFSYRYIEKSLQEGKLEDLEAHRIVPQRKQRKVSGARPKGSKTRNFFTLEEDEILLMALCQPGVKVGGNVVYQKLADEYPEHTMHSWRGRWVDHYSKLMPNGPRPLKKQQGQSKESDEGQVRIKREGEQFTEEDEAVLKKVAKQLLKDPNDMETYDRLSEKYPRHTPMQWRAHFTKVMLPKIKKENVLKKPDPERPTSNSREHDSADEEQSAASSRDRVPSKPRQQVKTKPEPTSSSPGPRHRRQQQPPVSTKSPIRTVDLRNHPRSTSQERKKPLTSRQPHKSAPSSPTYRPTSPTPRPGPHALSKTPLSAIPPPTMKSLKSPEHIPRWRVEHKTPTAEDNEPPPPSSPPKLLSYPLQKRKRDMSGFTPEQRKRSRNIYREVSEVASTPEPDSPVRSRVISPELQGSDAHRHPGSSPPLIKHKKYQKYAEMSTQALYDQVDDDPSFAEDMEFPEIPNTPPGAAQSPPPPTRLRRESTPPTKLPARTSVSVSKSPLPSPTEDDPDGIKEMEAFLAYCRKEYKLSEKLVIYSIERTSGIKPLVETVLQSIAEGKPLPTDVPGVWSEEEDKILMGADSREMKRLADKKGSAHTERRMEFLNLWNLA